MLNKRYLVSVEVLVYATSIDEAIHLVQEGNGEAEVVHVYEDDQELF